jgi:hypothetical protein
MSDAQDAALKNQVSVILHRALSGKDNEYHVEGGYVRWGLVEKHIHAAIDAAMREDAAKSERAAENNGSAAANAATLPDATHAGARGAPQELCDRPESTATPTTSPPLANAAADLPRSWGARYDGTPLSALRVAQWAMHWHKWHDHAECRDRGSLEAKASDAVDAALANAAADTAMGEDNARLRAALNLVWAMHIRREVHLGWERSSGLGECIPCTCALALGRSMDGDGGFVAADYDNAAAALLAREKEE